MNLYYNSYPMKPIKLKNYFKTRYFLSKSNQCWVIHVLTSINRVENIKQEEMTSNASS